MTELLASSSDASARRRPDAVSVEATLAFADPRDVGVDRLRPGGVLRAATQPSERALVDSLARHRMRLVDDAASGARQPGLASHGFEMFDLASRAPVGALLEEVRKTGCLTPTQAAQLRRRLLGRSFSLDGGRRRLRILYVADEGIICRKAGPNGSDALLGQPRTATSGHSAAVSVHVDQDVRGTPVRQILGGMGPWLFRHAAPDGANTWSPLHLVNVWIPLDQITRPLALMDERSFDRRRHQLRYALPTEDLLERDASRRLNDIWSVLPDEGQRWHFRSEMPFGSAYVFNTLSTAHCAFVLPGEEVAEDLSAQLRSLVAVLSGDEAVRASALRDSLTTSGPVRDPRADAPSTPALRRTIEAMEALLEEARGQAPSITGARAHDLIRRAQALCDRVVRKSIELRAVAWVSPAWWPASRRPTD